MQPTVITFWTVIVLFHIARGFACKVRETESVGYFEEYRALDLDQETSGKYWIQPDVKLLFNCWEEEQSRLDLQPVTWNDSGPRNYAEVVIEAPNAKVLDLKVFFAWLQQDEKVQNFTVEIRNSPMLESILVPSLKISKLRKLFLLGLNFSKIDYLLVRYFTNINELTVRDNRAETLEIDPVIGQRMSLFRMNLIGCRMKQVPFINLNRRSIELNLQNNYITTFDSEILEKMFKVSLSCWMNLAGNPISCDSSWNRTLPMLHSYMYLHLSFWANCSYPEYLAGREVKSVRSADLVTKVAPKLAPDFDATVGVLGNHLYLPCKLDAKNPAVPTAFKEWSFSGSRVIAFGDKIIYSSNDVIWAEIDIDGSLFVQTRGDNDQDSPQRFRRSKRAGNFTCYFYNSAGSGEINLNREDFKYGDFRANAIYRNDTSGQTSENQQPFLTQNIIIFGLAASFLVLFFALIGCSICVWRLRKRPKQPQLRVRSISRNRSRQSTVTRFSESGSFQPDVFRCSVSGEPRSFHKLEPTPEGNGSQHSSPTTSYTSQLEWDPQIDPASVYCERAVTPYKYQYEAKLNAIGSRSKHGSRLYSSSSERNV